MNRMKAPRGNILLGLLILSVISSIVFLTVARISTGTKEERFYALKDDRETVRRVVRERLDCGKTIAQLGTAPVCDAPFALKDQFNNDIGIPKFGSWAISKWNVRAICAIDAGAVLVTVESAIPLANGNFAKDPLLGGPKDWRPLFTQLKLDCETPRPTPTPTAVAKPDPEKGCGKSDK